MNLPPSDPGALPASSAGRRAAVVPNAALPAEITKLTERTDTAPLLQVRGLKTYFDTPAGVVKAVDGVDIDVYAGEVVGIVGESGSGKSVLSRSILRLVRQPAGRYAGGSIHFDGRDLLQLPERELRQLRGNSISMIFQEPMTSLNPVMTIGTQIAEALTLHQRLSTREAHKAAVALLTQVGIANAALRARAYPSALSGGMCQRAMIAMALACRPRLLIADEPTTALDVTIQAQILELLAELRQQFGMSILLITHNLGLIAEIADRVVVMYAGRAVESASVRQFFARPAHPYSQGLMGSLPKLDARARRLDTIPGNMTSAVVEGGCPFRARCGQAMPRCAESAPPLVTLEQGHQASCWLLKDEGEVA